MSYYFTARLYDVQHDIMSHVILRCAWNRLGLWDDPHTSIHSWVGTVGIVGEWAAVRRAELRSALSPDWSLN